MTNTTRHALPLPVTLLIAWAVGIAVFLALRALTTLIPQPTDSTSIVARANPNIILAVLTSAGTSLASALPVPILAYAYGALTLVDVFPRPGVLIAAFLAVGTIGALIGALPPWLIRRHRAERHSLTD